MLVLAFVLSGGLGTVRSTLAGWADGEYATATFEAATIGTVQNLDCLDSEGANPLGLLERQVKLDWDSPAGLEGVPLEYVVSWQRLLDSGTLPPTDETEQIYTSTPSLLSVTVGFSVHAQVKGQDESWAGGPSTTSALSVGLLGNILITCL